MLILKNKIIFFIFLAAFISLPFFTFASITNGTIDLNYKYAWSDQIGWINFGPTGAGGEYKGLTITDSSVTGYAWSNQYGWINFGPFQNNSDGGVKNTSAGVLSGYAWSNNLGWINFSGVNINYEGRFVGTASGDLIGIINFDLTKCTDCGVKTDWRPISGRESGGGGNNYSPTLPEPETSKIGDQENNNQESSSKTETKIEDSSIGEVQIPENSQKSEAQNQSDLLESPYNSNSLNDKDLSILTETSNQDLEKKSITTEVPNNKWVIGQFFNRAFDGIKNLILGTSNWFLGGIKWLWSLVTKIKFGY